MSKSYNESKEKMANMNNEVEGTTAEGSKTSGDKRRAAFEQLKRNFEKNPNDAAVGLEFAKAVSISVINRLTEFCQGMTNLLSTIFECTEIEKMVLAGNLGSHFGLNPANGKFEPIIDDKEQYGLLSAAAGKTYGDGGDVYYEAYGAIWEAYAKWGKGSQSGWLDRPVKLKKLKKYTYGSYADANKREYQEVEIVPIVWIYRKVRNYISNQKNPRQAASLADYGFDKETLENYYIRNKMFANINGDLDAFTATVNEWDSKKCEKLLVQILELFRNDSIKTATIKAFANYGNIADAARALGRNWSNVQKTRDIIRNTILKNKILTEKQVKALGISSRYYN